MNFSVGKGKLKRRSDYGWVVYIDREMDAPLSYYEQMTHKKSGRLLGRSLTLFVAHLASLKRGGTRPLRKSLKRRFVLCPIYPLHVHHGACRLGDVHLVA